VTCCTPSQSELNRCRSACGESPYLYLERQDLKGLGKFRGICLEREMQRGRRLPFKELMGIELEGLSVLRLFVKCQHALLHGYFKIKCFRKVKSYLIIQKILGILNTKYFAFTKLIRTYKTE